MLNPSDRNTYSLTPPQLPTAEVDRLQAITSAAATVRGGTDAQQVGETGAS